MGLSGVLWISCAVLATAFAAVGMWGVLAPRAQHQWTRVSGRVVRSVVEFDGEDFAAVVVYGYRHNGVDYTGSTVSLPRIIYNWRGPAERVCRRYPEGATISVYVHPRDARRAVLEPPGRIGVLTFLLISILLFAMAWALR